MTLRYCLVFLMALTLASTTRAQSSASPAIQQRPNTTPKRGKFGGRSQPPRKGSAQRQSAQRQAAQARLQSSQQKPAKKEDTFTVYSLRYADATSVAKLLNDLLQQTQGVRISIDNRTNRLLVFGDRGAHKMVSALLQTLDVPQREANVVRVYPVKNIAADQTLCEILKMAVEGANIAVDVRSNSVIVSSSETHHDAVTRLLERLDGQQKVKMEEKWQVRIVWLVSGAAKEIGSAVPKDLDNVVKELERIGVTAPKMTAQVVVSAENGSEFVAQGRAMLKQSANLMVSGKLTTRKADGKTTAPQLAISIDATSMPEAGGRPQGQPIASIETSITAPIRHSVVLGVTPYDKMTSVFVVQISPQGGR